MRAVRVRLSSALVEHLLHLPRDVRIVDDVEVVIRGERFAEVPATEPLPLVLLQATTPEPVIEFISVEAP